MPPTHLAKKPTTAKPAPSTDAFLNEIVESLVKESGDGAAQLLGSDGLAIKIRGVISTQCVTIDDAIGRGGIPLGRLTILHGPEGSGKTTVALHIVAECQHMGGVVVYIDKEYKMDPDYAKALGVDTQRLIISQPSHLESVFRSIDTIIKMATKFRTEKGVRVPILVVLDSMNAAITKKQFEGEWEDKFIGEQARVYSQLLPKLMPLVSKEDVALLFISQIRKKIGVMFGDEDEVAGGNAPKFYASLILHVQKMGTNKEGEEKISNKTQVYVKKNQIAPPFRKGDFNIVYGMGIDKESAIIDHAEKLGIVTKSGAWYNFGEARLGQGLKMAADLLRSSDDLKCDILAAISKGK